MQALLRGGSCYGGLHHAVLGVRGTGLRLWFAVISGPMGAKSS